MLCPVDYPLLIHRTWNLDQWSCQPYAGCRCAMPLVFNQLLKCELAPGKVIEKLQLEHKRYIILPIRHVLPSTKSTVYKRHACIKTGEQWWSHRKFLSSNLFSNLISTSKLKNRMTQIHSHLMLGRVCLTTNAGPYKPKEGSTRVHSKFQPRWILVARSRDKTAYTEIDTNHIETSVIQVNRFKVANTERTRIYQHQKYTECI